MTLFFALIFGVGIYYLIVKYSSSASTFNNDEEHRKSNDIMLMCQAAIDTINDLQITNPSYRQFDNNIASYNSIHVINGNIDLFDQNLVSIVYLKDIPNKRIYMRYGKFGYAFTIINESKIEDTDITVYGAIEHKFGKTWAITISPDMAIFHLKNESLINLNADKKS